MPFLRSGPAYGPFTMTNLFNRKPSEGIVWDFYNPSFYFPESLKHFPAHLHIDIIDGSSGIGHGTKLMNMLLDAMRKKGVKGVHLGMVRWMVMVHWVATKTCNWSIVFLLRYGFIRARSTTEHSSSIVSSDLSSWLVSQTMAVNLRTDHQRSQSICWF
jgi:hypothetical protein